MKLLIVLVFVIAHGQAGTVVSQPKRQAKQRQQGEGNDRRFTDLPE
jgi:hypothetical protein